MQKKILVPTSPAELFDKITILEIKNQKISDPDKRKNIKHELELLSNIVKSRIEFSPELEILIMDLREINANGWSIEDGKRDCEKRNDFGPKFIEFARNAFKNNDRRAAIWKKINILLKADIIQEKSYEKY